MVSSSGRLYLIQTLSSLPDAQFKQVVFALDPPKGSLPTEASQGKVAAVLLDWLESPTGRGTNTLREILVDLGLETLPPTGICPYKGLSYFDCNDEDYKYFYGRNALTQTLLERVAESNFLVIVGASGSGKSSVLRAGLLQHLKHDGGYELRILVPGEHPLQSLARAFVDEASDRLDRAGQQAKAEALIAGGADGLRRLVQNSDTKRVFLVVDQFEESFTLCQDKAERQTFFETLLGGLNATPSQLCLILAMRSDFVGKCFEQDYGGLAEKVKSHLEPVLPMTTEEMTLAIEAPARQTGIALEPGLTLALLEDLEQSPGGLPLLQYTLTELWQRQQDNQLKLSVYHQLGGVAGTLKQRADEVYRSLTPEQQLTAKHIFLNLTQLGEGAEDTRRRVAKSSLVTAKHSEPLVNEVVQALANANLVVTSELISKGNQDRVGIVDVAHEALIRSWPKLRQWLEGNRDLLQQQRKIELAAEEWIKQPKKQQQSYLLQGRQLSDANAFKKTHSEALPLSAQAERYLARSLKHRRNDRLKLIGVGIIIPLGLAGYAGVQAATYFRLRPHWDVINAYAADTNKVGRDPLVRALQELNSASRSLRRISLNSANLISADLRSADLYSADLSNANLRSADLSNANLSQADLIGANLSQADLIGANLRSADLHSANLSDADLSDADLSDADLISANLIGANLISADLHSANLSDADLRSANFGSANLRSANLRSANLRSANLHDANLRSADLRDALLLATDLRSAQNLTESQFTGETPPYLCNTPLPAEIAIDKDRDCDRLPQLLVDKGWFSNIEAAKAYVEELRQKIWDE
jgi:uncharacterized protein YjbI with pentapeptide repeats/energy-coupling factor transporter ATP-binding protein EcfA2